jgi:hypothetical protein
VGLFHGNLSTSNLPGAQERKEIAFRLLTLKTWSPLIVQFSSDKTGETREEDRKRGVPLFVRLFRTRWPGASDAGGAGSHDPSRVPAKHALAHRILHSQVPVEQAHVLALQAFRRIKKDDTRLASSFDANQRREHRWGDCVPPIFSRCEQEIVILFTIFQGAPPAHALERGQEIRDETMLRASPPEASPWSRHPARWCTDVFPLASDISRRGHESFLSRLAHQAWLPGSLVDTEQSP